MLQQVIPSTSLDTYIHLLSTPITEQDPKKRLTLTNQLNGKMKDAILGKS
jgi:hypothetical protein